MRILLVGAGGVGDAIAKIAARRNFFDTMIVSDYDISRAERTIAWITAKHGDQGTRFLAAAIDASDPDNVAAVARQHGATHVMNAVEPKFVPTIFAGALAAGADYLDMAMSPVGAASDRSVLADRRQTRRRPVRSGARLGDGRQAGPGGHGGSNPVSATSSRAMRPTTCSPRSTNSACVTVPTSWSPTTSATRSSPHHSASGPPSRSASTPR